jgi:multidrug resistance efflux pump
MMNTIHQWSLFAGLIIASLASTCPAQSRNNPATIELDNCHVKAIDDVEVPAREAGALLTMTIKKGSHVAADTEIARVDDRMALLTKERAIAAYDAAQLKAKSGAAIQFAIAALDTANSRLNRLNGLFQKGGSSASELEEQELTVREAELRVLKSKEEQKIDTKTAAEQSVVVKQSEEQIARHRIISPIEGEVFDVLRDQGEWVKVGDVVARIVRMDRLKVETSIDATKFNPDELLGKPVTVRSFLARDEIVEFEGKVVDVDIVKIGGTEYMVSAEVQNKQHNGQWLLRLDDQPMMLLHINE